MAANRDTISAAAGMICKAVVLAARWAGARRRRALEKIAVLTVDEKDKEILLLRQQLTHLRDQVAFLQKQLGKGTGKRRYSIGEKLFVIFQMEYLGLPRRRVTEYFGVARSTLYRWLHRIHNPKQQAACPANKTPAEVAALVWEIANANVDWGRVRIANQLKVLGVFLSASTVRNILNRPRPRGQSPAAAPGPIGAPEAPKPRSLSAFYPNHVWPAHLRVVRRWGLWPTYMFVVTDHFSRKLMTVSALKRLFKETPTTGYRLKEAA